MRALLVCRNLRVEFNTQERLLRCIWREERLLNLHMGVALTNMTQEEVILVPQI